MSSRCTAAGVPNKVLRGSQSCQCCRGSQWYFDRCESHKLFFCILVGKRRHKILLNENMLKMLSSEDQGRMGCLPSPWKQCGNPVSRLIDEKILSSSVSGFFFIKPSPSPISHFSSTQQQENRLSCIPWQGILMLYINFSDKCLSQPALPSASPQKCLFLSSSS